jgi:mannose/fructose-specific phosphotransferase system component IIA
LTHGKFAEGIADSYRMIAGEQSIYTICISDESSPEEVDNQLEAFMASTKEEDSVVVMTDIPAGSSTQAAFKLLRKYQNVHLVTGLNLTLLLGIAFSDTDDDEECIKDAVEEAKSSISYLNEVMKSM